MSAPSGNGYGKQTNLPAREFWPVRLLLYAGRLRSSKRGQSAKPGIVRRGMGGETPLFHVKPEHGNPHRRSLAGTARAQKGHARSWRLRRTGAHSEPARSRGSPRELRKCKTFATASIDSRSQRSDDLRRAAHTTQMCRFPPSWRSVGGQSLEWRPVLALWLPPERWTLGCSGHFTAAANQARPSEQSHPHHHQHVLYEAPRSLR